MKGLLLVNGRPGSGKSTDCRNVVESRHEIPHIPSLEHISVGARVRGISSGFIESQYSKKVRELNDDIAGMKMIDNSLVSNIVREYIELRHKDSITLIDGFPSEVEQISNFIPRPGLGIVGLLLLSVC